MKIQEAILYSLSKRWKSPVKKQRKNFGEDVTSVEYHLNYALYLQYLQKVRSGLNFDFYDKSILEIGCGHGGISCFLAVNGAQKVVGIDLNTFMLKIANKFKSKFSVSLGDEKGGQIPVEFLQMNATELKFSENSFDIVIADNVFEHFVEPEKVLSEIYRVLSPNGILVVPSFSSWWSKHALHLKHGLKVPWANLFFSEKTIVNVLYRLATENQNIFKMYPGLKEKPVKVRDVRKYKDLNYITYGSFKKIARQERFEIKSFTVNGTRKLRLLSSIVRKIPIINKTIVIDILSTSAAAVLKK